jgi:hypothetical protein
MIFHLLFFTMQYCFQDYEDLHVKAMQVLSNCMQDLESMEVLQVTSHTHIVIDENNEIEKKKFKKKLSMGVCQQHIELLIKVTSNV